MSYRRTCSFDLFHLIHVHVFVKELNLNDLMLLGTIYLTLIFPLYMYMYCIIYVTEFSLEVLMCCVQCTYHF